MTLYPRPLATIDLVTITQVNGVLCVGSLQRLDPNEPACGERALPGGVVRLDTDHHLDQTATRVFAQKIGGGPAHIEQAGTNGDAHRDPRGWSLSVFYLAVLHDPDTRMLEWHPIDAVPSLAFDHNALVVKALDRFRAKAFYSALPLFLLPPLFTITDALMAYTLVLGDTIDPANFRRKLLATGLLEPCGYRHGAGRKAVVYQMNPTASLTFSRPLVA